MSKAISEKIVDSVFHTLIFITIMPVVTIRQPETMRHPIKTYKRIITKYENAHFTDASNINHPKKEKSHDWDKSPRKLYKINVNQNKRIQRPRTHNIRSQIRK